MLSTNMKERLSGRIELLDMKLKTGQDLLSYLYNSKLEPGMDLKELLVVADRYDLAELLDTCAVSLTAELSKKNCLDLLLLGYLQHAPQLKAAAMNYVKVHCKSMFSVPHWEDKFQDHSSLLAEIIKVIAK